MEGESVIKVVYKGFEIKAEREKTLGGWENIYYTVMCIKDGWYLEDSFYGGEDKVRDFINSLKVGLIDDYYENSELYEG